MKSTRDTIRTALEHINTGFETRADHRKEETTVKKTSTTAAPTTELTAAQQDRIDRTVTPICRKCGTDLDEQAQAQGSQKDGKWTCGPCLKTPAPKPEELPSMVESVNKLKASLEANSKATATTPAAPTVGMVSLKDQDAQIKKANKKAKPEPTVVVEIKVEPTDTTEMDAKRAKMLAQLAAARAAAAERRKAEGNGATAPKVKPTVPKPVSAPTAQVDKLDTLLDRVSLLVTRLTDLAEKLEQRVYATA